ncbi:uroporphyrinogen decarboxylase [Thraustotheca clavata]|uniref:Uroporphyrinogen decarboxylase n=1 Tax=Thraustotheca clavata TaxID=74557 RepID=A0A1V9YGA3_9STRA|nr:uroporphyrinogen decarboxylase [Thraustotheca clavata]
MVKALVPLLAVAAAAMAMIALRQREKKKHAYPFKRTPIKRLPLDQLPRLKNDLLVRAYLGQKTERVPVWCMRQAGRHLPEFRALREAGYDFFTMCQVPELAVEVSLQPLRRYATDAVIIFCDILVVPQAMGMEVKMVSGVGPVLPQPLRTPEDLARLNKKPDIEATLGYLMDALNLARQEINGQVPLIGFSGAPFTLFTYMVEGGGSRTKDKVKSFLYKYPQAAHEALQAITDVCVEYLIAQYQAGAQALQIFESVGAEYLTQDHFYEFAFPYLAQIAERVREAVPATVPLVGFSKGTQYAYEKLSYTKYDCLSLDWQSDPTTVREQVGGRVSLQGNLDSAAIYAAPEVIREEVSKMLKKFGTQGYVANLGHGCAPDFSPENVDTFIKSVQQISFEMNSV